MSVAPSQESPPSTALPTPPRGPTLEAWARMSAAAQSALEVELGQRAIDYENAVLASLPDAERWAMAESEEHQDATYGSREALRAFFRRAGRSLYIASNLPVYYPGEEHFAPDLLAVWDVPLRKRASYLVAQEKKGLDLAIEVLYRGDRNKDLVVNVARYAKLGIREYFAVDLLRRRIHGYRLESATAQRYTPLLGNDGRYRSVVLDLDLAIEGDELRFYAGTAVVPLLGEEVIKLAARAASAEEKAASAEEKAASAEEKAASAEEEALGLRQKLAESLLLILRLRGLAMDEEQEAKVRACQDSVLLQRWLSRAATASLTEIFLDS